MQGCSSKVKNTTDSVKQYPAFDVQNMDTTIKPGDDFFTYTNGTWLKNNPIPADKNSRSLLMSFLKGTGMIYEK